MTPFGVLAQAGITPESADVAKSIVQATDGRADTTFLATIVLVIGGLSMTAMLAALAFWLPRFINRIIDNCSKEQLQLSTEFRAEMERERQFHAERLDTVATATKQSSERIAGAVDKLSQAICTMPGSRRRVHRDPNKKPEPGLEGA